ncbi:hypothetical protein [Brevibacterium gallinarum]|uniref:Bacterial Pleckstrin homology domain-containing protein n=1 Tax=Brevibacterium gallinarum TaxID=2762220 RepID=A0ABR8WS86_9MICO|nr:hypothetical protein [Brevibacterium gallinarum]MBD8019792.1 hypothetical protein [Brevibacterium gallinarum]
MAPTSPWSVTTALSPLPAVILAVSIATMAGLTIAYWPEVGWFMLACTVFVIVIAAPFFAAGLQVDDTGVTTASVLGFPRVHIRPEEITGLEVVRIDALGDYLGWGWRSNRSAKGFVLRDGPALIIHRTAGKAIVFTTPEAEDAAARIGTMAPH